MRANAAPDCIELATHPCNSMTFTLLSKSQRYAKKHNNAVKE